MAQNLASVQGTSSEFVIDVSVKLKEDLSKITTNLDKLTKSMQKVAASAGINAKSFKEAGIGMEAFAGIVKDQDQIMFEFNKEMAQLGAEAQALPNKMNALRNVMQQMAAAGKQNTAEFAAYEAKLRQLGAGSIAAGTGLKSLRGQVQNASFQITDFIVSVQGGTKASVALGQQLPQLLAGFGAWGAALGLVASLLGPFIARMFEAEKETKTLADLSEQLSQGFNKVGVAVSAMNMDKLVETYNKADAATRTLIRSNLQLQLTLEQSRVARLKDEASNKARTALEDAQPGFFTSIAANTRGASFATSQAASYAKQISNLAESFNLSKREAESFLRIQTQVAKGQQDFGKFAQELAESVPEGKLSSGAIELVDELTKLQTVLDESAKTSADAKKAFDEFSKTGDTGQVQTIKSIAAEQKRSAGVATKALNEQAKSLQELQREYASLYESVKTPAEKLADIQAKLAEITSSLGAGADPDVIKRIYDKAIADNADEITKATIKWKESLVAAGQEIDSVTPKLAFLQSELSRLRESGDTSSGYFQALSEQFEKLSPEIQGMIDEFDNMAEKLKSSKNPVEDFKNMTAELSNEFNSGAIPTLKLYKEELGKLTSAFEQASKDNALNKALQEINNKIGTTISGVFDDIINNIGKAKFSMADFAESFLRDIAKMITQLLIVKPLMESLQPLVSEWGTSLANSLGAGTGTSAPAVAPVVQGGGASFVQPTAVRLSSASAVEPIRRSIGGGSSAIGSTVVNINNTVSNQAQVDVTSKTGIDGSKTLDIMVTAKVREMFANGTMDQQMRSTFGIRRQPA